MESNELLTLPIEAIKTFAGGHDKIIAVYVFGSFATGKNRAKSDVDVAIMIQGTMDGFERIDLETRLSNLLGCDADLVVFGQASPLLQHQILKYGVLVYEKDSKERVRQEVRSRYAYLDSLFLFKEIYT